MLTELQSESVDRNLKLLKRTKREMVRRKELHDRRAKQKDLADSGSSSEGGEPGQGSDSDEDGDEGQDA